MPEQNRVFSRDLSYVRSRSDPLVLTSFRNALWDIQSARQDSFVTLSHTHWKTRDPVCSPIQKQVMAKLVVGSVMNSNLLVLYVCFLPFLFDKANKTAAEAYIQCLAFGG
jgi:hypothetical protein